MSSVFEKFFLLIMANWLLQSPIPPNCYEAGPDGVPLLYSTIDRPTECQPENHGDFNFDGVVNFLDMAQIMEIYPYKPMPEKKLIDMSYYITDYWLLDNASRDINKDGIINFTDFALFATNEN